ncbi:MAG: oligosaccharide flippase family protein, partial [Pseudonocardiaceae bacterium]
LGDGGLTLWTQREIVRRPHDLSRLIAQTLVAQIVLAVAAMSALAVIAFVAPLPEGTAILIVAAAPTALAQALNTMYVLQALEWMRAAALVKIVIQFIAAGLAITLVVLTHQPVWVITTMWMGQLAGSGLALAILLRGKGLRAERPTVANVRTTLVAGLPILGSLALVHYSQMMDTVVLGFVRSSYEVGIYAAAARLMVIAAVLAMVVANAMYPEMVRRHAESDERLGEFSGRALALALRLSIGAAALTAVLAPVIIDVLYDPRFAGTIDVLRILAFMFPVLCFNSLGTQVLMAAGLRKRLLIGVGIGAGFATVAIPLGAVAFGGIGTAIALLSAMVVQCSAFTWLARGPLTTGWRQLLGREIGFGLVLCAGLAGAQHVTSGQQPLVVAATCLIGLAVIEAVRGFPTLDALAPRLLARRAS